VKSKKMRSSECRICGSEVTEVRPGHDTVEGHQVTGLMIENTRMRIWMRRLIFVLQGAPTLDGNRIMRSVIFAPIDDLDLSEKISRRMKI
jgi:hypothetical protein